MVPSLLLNFTYSGVTSLIFSRKASLTLVIRVGAPDPLRAKISLGRSGDATCAANSPDLAMLYSHTTTRPEMGRVISPPATGMRHRFTLPSSSAVKLTYRPAG